MRSAWQRLLNRSSIVGWLIGTDAGGRRDALSITDNVIRLDVSGTIDAPSLTSLTTLLDTELVQTFEVQLTWLKRESVSGEVPSTPDQVLADRIDLLARDWAATRAVSVSSTSFDGLTATIEVVGPVEPDATALVAGIRELLDPGDQITVLFVERRDITTTTVTTTTTTIAN